MRYRLMTVAVAAACVTLAAPAFAATMYYLDVPALVEESDAVVVGRVTEADVFIGDHGRITTAWTIEVEYTVLGEPVNAVRVLQWAGELDGVVEHVPGDAHIALGDHMVFFLRGESPERMYLTALSQSVFQVHDELLPGAGTVSAGPLGVDPQAWERAGATPLAVPVSRQFDDLVLFVRTNVGPEAIAPATEAMTLGALLERVRAAEGAE